MSTGPISQVWLAYTRGFYPASRYSTCDGNLDINSESYQGSGANLGIIIIELEQDLLLFIGWEPEMSSKAE